MPAFLFFLGTQLDYISQPPLQFKVATWMNCCNWMGSKSDVCLEGLSHENSPDSLIYVLSSPVWLERRWPSGRWWQPCLMNTNLCTFSGCLTASFFPKLPITIWAILQQPLLILLMGSPSWMETQESPQASHMTLMTYSRYKLWSSTLLHNMPRYVFSGWPPEWSCPADHTVQKCEPCSVKPGHEKQETGRSPLVG